MDIAKTVFQKFTPDYEKLIKYGFNFDGEKYLFEKNFMNNDFLASVCITIKGKISANVYDLENNEEFLPLKIADNQGAFVGEVRNIFTEILTDIRNNCFIENYFISNQANRIAGTIFEKYGDSPVFMWEKYPTFGVFKNPASNKWYGIIMNINRTKLGDNKDEHVDIINLKLDKNKIPDLLKQKGFYGAWHMNKKLWITLTLDETLSDNEIMKYIDESHFYTLKKKR